MTANLEDELQALFDKRREIDRALLERHATDMAVLFTDIVGSTAYFEQRGDIEGLALVRRHNELLFPVPWELLHDGKDWLGCRFSVGRMVSAKADAAVPPPSSGAKDIVVVANRPRTCRTPRRRGAWSRSSSRRRRRTTSCGGMGRCRAPTSSRWWRARVLHFAGHVRKGQGDLDGGFVLHDGIVTAADLKRALGKSAPLLVFANGCHASTSEKWAAASSLAQALLLAGVRHTLAQMWAGPDADALSFALRFYEAALAGVPFGECARDARGRPSPPRTRRRSRSPATCSTASRARSTGSASAWRRR